MSKSSPADPLDPQGEIASQQGTLREDGRGVQEPGAFDALLVLLDPDRPKALEIYFQSRTMLIRFFAWRGYDQPEELADETLDRVVAKLATGAVVERKAVRSYILGVARKVFLEAMRRRLIEREVLADLKSTAGRALTPASEEGLLASLLHCLDQITTGERRLIRRYYEGDSVERVRIRQDLADELGVPLNALRIRAYRIRKRLEDCAREQLSGGPRARSRPFRLLP
jgi:DNA-directed RNA polymerase specialized sigma24 family protein